MQQFFDFILKSGNYPALHLDSEPQYETHETMMMRRSIILIQDLPFLYDEKSRARFQNFFNSLLKSNEKRTSPIVLIISDMFFDQSDARFFLSGHIMDHPLCKVIR